MTGENDLIRFVEAQEHVFGTASQEIKNGRKSGKRARRDNSNLSDAASPVPAKSI